MKKILITCTTAVATLCAYNAAAQPGFQPHMNGVDIETTIDSRNVGIGTDPALPVPFKLTVNGDFGFENTPGLNQFRHIIGENNNHGIAIWANHGWHNGSGVLLEGDNTENPSAVSVVTTQTGIDDKYAFNIWRANGAGNWTDALMRVRKNAHTSIGLNTPQHADDMLTVGGALTLHNPDPATYRAIRGRTNNSGVVLWGNSSWHDGAGILLDGNGTTNPGSMAFVTTPNGGGTNGAFTFWKANSAGNWTDRLMTIQKSGKIGLGLNVAMHNDDGVTVGGSLALYEANPSAFRTIRGRTNSSGIVVWSNTGWHDGSGILMEANGTNSPGTMSFVTSPGGGGGNDAFAFWKANSSGAWTEKLMTVRKDGKVGIGTNVTYNMPGDYRLYVERGIMTERIRVAVPGTGQWSDFVFAADYDLMPLAEVEEYIKENKHLPEIPSAEQVVKEGIDLGAMDAKLLQKIEELTLHMIEQNKKIELQQKEIELLKKQQVHK